MVIVEYNEVFIKKLFKIKDEKLKLKIKKQIIKLKRNPWLGKPMRHERKGTREVYIKPYRLSYIYFEDKIVILFLDIYHKDNQ